MVFKTLSEGPSGEQPHLDGPPSACNQELKESRSALSSGPVSQEVGAAQCAGGHAPRGDN